MSDLAAALAATHREHSVVPCSESTPSYFARWALCEACGWESERLTSPLRDWEARLRELGYSHIASRQVAYLRENLAEHAEELGMTRESKLRLRGDGHWSEDFRHLTNWSCDDHA